MISYKIYTLPGICEKTVTGTFEANEAATVGGLLDAIATRHGVDFKKGVEFMTLLDGKALDLPACIDNAIGDGSELLILPAIMGG